MKFFPKSKVRFLAAIPAYSDMIRKSPAILMIFPILILAGCQQAPAVKRLHSFLSSQKQYEVSADVLDPKGAVHGNVNVVYQAPDYQKYTYSNPKDKFEWIQDLGGTLFVDHTEKKYLEIPFFGELFGPGKYGDPEMASCYPIPLLSPRFLDQIPKWTEKPLKDGVAQISFKDPNPLGRYEVEFDVAPDGKPKRLHFLRVGEESVDITWVFKDWKPSKQPASFFVRDLPLGYVPFYHFMPDGTIARFETFRSKTAFDARKQTSTPIKDLMGKSGIVFVFTQPDCDISNRSDKSFDLIAAELAKQNVKFAEIVLGQDKPDLVKKSTKRLILWDKDGLIERDNLIKDTPHFIILKPDLTVVGGYQGCKAGDEVKIAKLLLDGLKQTP